MVGTKWAVVGPVQAAGLGLARTVTAQPAGERKPASWQHLPSPPRDRPRRGLGRQVAMLIVDRIRFAWWGSIGRAQRCPRRTPVLCVAHCRVAGRETAPGGREADGAGASYRKTAPGRCPATPLGPPGPRPRIWAEFSSQMGLEGEGIRAAVAAPTRRRSPGGQGRGLGVFGSVSARGRRGRRGCGWPVRTGPARRL
jgi:hypothetical protein